MTLINCQNIVPMTIRHFKGFHVSWPFRYSRLKNKTHHVEKFTFIQPEFDNKDTWNILTGVKLNYFNATEDCILVVWRWNTETKLVEVGFFKEKSEDFAEVLFTFPKGESIEVCIMYDVQYVGHKYVMTVQHNKQKRATFLKTNKAGWLVNAWLGEAPNNQVKIHSHVY